MFFLSINLIPLSRAKEENVTILGVSILYFFINLSSLNTDIGSPYSINLPLSKIIILSHSSYSKSTSWLTIIIVFLYLFFKSLIRLIIFFLFL